MYTCFYHLRLSSIMLCGVIICSVQELPLRELLVLRAVCDPHEPSVCSVTCCRKPCLVQRGVLPLQLLKSLRQHFFRSGMIAPSFHSFGTSSTCHVIWELLECLWFTCMLCCKNRPKPLFSSYGRNRNCRRNYIFSCGRNRNYAETAWLQFLPYRNRNWSYMPALNFI